MTEINIPARLNELVLNSESGFQIGSEWNPCDFSDEEIKNHFDDFAGISSSDGGLDVLTQDTIDVFYNLIANFRNLSDENKDLFAQSFTELSALAIETIKEKLSVEKKNARKQVVYFLVEFLKINEEVAKEENAEIEKLATQKGTKVLSKGKAKTADQTYSWTDWRHSCLKLIFQAVCSEPSHLWNMGVVQENYLRGMWASALSMLVDKPKGMGGPGVLESTIRGLCVAIITRCASLFGSGSGGSIGALSSALLDAVIKTEHMANFVAEICNKSKQTPLCREVLLAISHLHITSMSLGAKNIGSFIEALARVNPVLMSSHLATLKGQIDSPAHQIRSSLLQAMGLVVSSIHKASQGHTGSTGDKGDTLNGEDDENGGEKKDLNADGEEDDDKDKESNKGDDDDESAEEKDKEKESDVVSDHNMAQLSRVRDSLLDLLTERTHDISYFTRAAVLKVWVTLLEERSVPVKRITSVVELAVDRLRDKTAAVRRQALCVLTALLENNPFSGDLGVDAYTLKRTEIEAMIKERIMVLKECSAPPIELDLISGKNVPKKGSDRTTVCGKEVEIGEGEEGGEEGEEDEDDEKEFKNSDDVKLDAEMISLNNQLTYVLSVLDFLNILSGSLPRIEELGRSKSSTDVIEVVRFFIRAVNFNIKGTRKSLQKTFSLIWHSEENIRQECLNAFKSTYLTDGATLCVAESLGAVEVANNLIRVCAMCDVSESASLEQIIGELFSKNEVDKNVIPELWNMALKNNGNTSELELQHAADSLNILSMIAKFQPEILSSSRIRLIAQNGISESLNYLNRYNETKSNKLKIGNDKNGNEENENENDKENISSNIARNISKNEENKNDDRVEKSVVGDRGREEVEWTAYLNILKASMKCIQMISVKNILPETKEQERGSGGGSAEEDVKAACSACFIPMRNVLLGTFLGDDSAMTEKWFSVCEETIFALYHIHPSPDIILSSIIPPLFGSIHGNNNTKNDSKNHTGPTGKVYCSPAKLSRLLFILGQCALCSVVYVEKLADWAKKCADKKSVETKAVKEVEKEEADAMEDEMGLAAASDYDHEKQFNYIVERELVFENLLGKFHPFIAFIVANEEKGKQGFGPYGAPIVRETALLALCRYMCVSNAMCEMYLALVFTALENEPMAVNRTTVMIALADLAFRFPNVIEPWTKRIYSRLSDDDTVVRYNTLMVLTHLILNDMIKVKGQVSHVVMMLNDPCFEIRELATLFFTKLSERSNNPIYNLLGDIIATLSRDKKQKDNRIPELSSGSGDIIKNNEGESNKLKNKENEKKNENKNENENKNNNENKNENENEKKDGDSDLMDVVSEVEKKVEKEGVHYDENELEVEVVHVAVVDLEEEHFPSRTLCVKEFQTTLHFLLGFVKKDKQADGLFERLIIRLGMAQTLIQKRNLAFCISELSVGVKGLKKMIELFRHIRGALHDGQVFESIKHTVAKAKKMHTMRHSNSAGEDGEEKSGEEVVKTSVKSKGKAKKSMLNTNGENGEDGGGEGDTNVQPIVSSDDFKSVIEELENLLKEFGNVKTKSGDNQNENDGDEEGNAGTQRGDSNDDEEGEEGGGKGRGNESIYNNSKNKKATVKSKVTQKSKSKPASKSGKGKKKEESSDEESEEEEDDEEEEEGEEEKAVPVVAKNKKVEKKSLNKKIAAANSDTEEEDEMDFE